MSKYFTTEDAAKYLGVTPSRVRQFIAEERLESEKYGRDHMIKESALADFAKHGKKEARQTQEQQIKLAFMLGLN